MNYSNINLYDISKLNPDRSTAPCKSMLALGGGSLPERDTTSLPVQYQVFPESDPEELCTHGRLVITMAREMIGLLCTFGYATRRTLSEFLVMRGIFFSSEAFDKTLSWLRSHRMLVSTELEHNGFRLPLYGLDEEGLHAAVRMRIDYHPKLYSNCKDISDAKRYAQTAQLVSHFISSGLPIHHLSVRRVVVDSPENGGIVRPSVSINADGEMLLLEVIRRREGWQDEVLDKLKRYEAVFGAMETHTLIINGEDYEMNLEISRIIEESDISFRPLYTEDLLTFGKCFCKALYGFDHHGVKESYEITIPQVA